MKLTYEEVENIHFNGGITKDDKELSVVEEGEWISEHKCESMQLIFTDGEKFYETYVGRSGSDFTYYSYDSEIYGSDSIADITEVEKREVTVVKWVTK
jgi:hypothetical protein